MMFNPGIVAASAPGPPPVTLLTDLISYWSLNDDLIDAHGNNDGTGTPDASYATGIINNAFNCANARYISVTEVDDTLVTDAMTFSCWIYPTANNANNGVVTKGNLVTTNSDWSCLLVNSQPWFYASNVGLGLQSTTALTTNAWNHLVCRYNGSTAKIFLNNVEIASTAFSTNFTDTNPNLYLGTYFNTDTQYSLLGRLDEVGYWKRALTVDEIDDLYNGGAGLPYSSF
jgi:hypothetical protein